jgi:hypothetical protein
MQRRMVAGELVQRSIVVHLLTSHRNRDSPTGYLAFAISFKDGQPTEPANSTSAAVTVLSNPDNSKCPNGCFRPVGLAWDSKGRLIMSSDRTGEIFVIGKADGSPLDTATLASSTSSSSPSGTKKSGAIALDGRPGLAVLSAVFTAAVLCRLSGWRL